jgi:predicted ATPase
MLRRIYADNYRALVNFELKLGQINLFLGPNGSGKSAVFEVLRKLVSFVGGYGKVSDVFGSSDCTRWQDSCIQTFELEIAREADVYKYELAIEHAREEAKLRVRHERLWLNNKPLIRFENFDKSDFQPEVQLYRDDHSMGPRYPFDWSQSALASIFPRKENRHLTWFKERLQRVLVVAPVPQLMTEVSAQEEVRPSARLENYASWYRYLSLDQQVVIRLNTSLREAMPEFDHFKFEPLGEDHRLLRVHLRNSDGTGTIGYRFTELSEGQRTLIALYTLMAVSQTEGAGSYTLCLDEPENFLALPEIQPWLTSLYDSCSEGEVQALVISHHPELINYLLASPVGYWFERECNRPTRVKPIATDDGSGLPISELIARGWLRE